MVASSPVIPGSGEHRVLAVHGWFGSARVWGSLPEYPDGSARTYAFMDLRGYGNRKQAGGRFTMEQTPHRVRRLVGVNPVPAAGVPMDEQTWALPRGAAGGPRNRAAIIGFTTGSKLTKSFMGQVVRHSLENSVVDAFGAYLEVLANAGHYPMFETPVALATSIERFLGRE